MIDVETEIFNELAERIYAEYPSTFITAQAVERPASFPAVSIIETTNAEAVRREDSSGDENGADLIYTIDCYSNSISEGKAICKRIMQIVDKRLKLLNMTRSFCRPIDNAVDPSIYRMTARYTGMVDKNNVFYRR